MQRAHHAWVIDARIVPDGDNQLRAVEVVQRDGAFANANGLRQANVGRFMAHVGTVGEVIAAELPRKQLEQIGRLIGRPAGGVKLYLLRRPVVPEAGGPPGVTFHHGPRRAARIGRGFRRAAIDADSLNVPMFQP